ncbi:epigen [Rhinoderma darwinii]|uniref:epigen n=1 Tax=Rhinoderma darwinii TaxID=43563 RepID=UPI003F66D294
MALHVVFSVLTCALMTVLGEEISGTISPYTSNRNSTPESNNNFLYEDACPEDYTSFCINGGCFFLKSIGEPLCRCNSGFTGQRCENIILSATKVNEMEATHIAVGIGVGLLISGLIAFLWFYKEKRCKKTGQNHTRCNIEETLQQVNVVD